MAIAHDATSRGIAITTALTFSHTCTGSDLTLLVFATSNGGHTISGATYNGVSMTMIGSPILDAAGPRNYCFRLIAPATGAHNVVVSASGSAVIATAISYTGTDQTTQPDASTTTASATTTSYTSTITTVTDGAWIVASSRTGNGFTLTAGANTTVRIQPETTYLGSGAVWDSGAAKSPAGSYSVNVTCSSQLFGGAHVVALRPAGGGGGGGAVFVPKANWYM